jgi:hypothetical protein
LNPFPLFEEEAKMSIAQSPLQFPTEDSTQNTLAFKRKFNLSHSSSSSSSSSSSKSGFHFFFLPYNFNLTNTVTFLKNDNTAHAAYDFNTD